MTKLPKDLQYARLVRSVRKDQNLDLVKGHLFTKIN